MKKHLSVCDAEVKAVADVFGAVPDLGAHLLKGDALALIHVALTAAAEARCPEFVRADGTVFQIGTTFSCGRKLWRCTDGGTRTVIAIRIDQVVKPGRLGDGETWTTEQNTVDPRRHPGWLLGPPYKVVEFSFDEEDIEMFTPISREKVTAWEPDHGEGAST